MLGNHSAAHRSSLACTLCYSACVNNFFLRAALILLFALPAGAPARAQEDEIVANLAGGRAFIHVANGAIVFAGIDHPLESKSIPLRVAAIDSRHIGIFFGASEWQVSSQPRPIRLDRDIPHFSAPDRGYVREGGAEQDLEQIGVAFLEKLRPLVSQLHHPIELKPDEPLFQIVLLGYAPRDYGPEVWLIEFQVEQTSAARGDYLQTHILRPRFTQLYPPEKHQPKYIVEVRVPSNLPDIPLLGLLQQNPPAMARVRSSDQHISKVVDQIQKGEAQKADPAAAGDFLRATLPILAGDAHFFLGTMTENGRFDWIVPPEEPVEKIKTTEDKNRPPDAPTLKQKPKP
ncbi:MAG TPA: hypothetical protein VNI81_07735 [Candidatus Limnocylindrales bacterium]|nr:hypothetical protein [Candidatus Limnocylindrales bacterium]